MFKGKAADFSGQTIFVGVDVHKKNWKVCVVLDGKEIKQFSQNPDPDLLVSSLKSRFENAHISVAYEAGFSGHSACRRLRELGVDCIVVNAADIPTSDKDRKTKTDKRDARKLAKELCKGSLEGIFVPECEIESFKSLTRLRTQLVRNRTRSINLLKHYLMQYNVQLDQEFTRLTKAVKAQILELKTGLAAKDFALQTLLEEYEHCCKMVCKVTLELRRLSREHEQLKDVQPLLQSVNGIGPVHGMVFQSEIGDITRFKNTDQLCSYSGLVPDIYSSGDKSARQGITRRCNAHLKTTLIEASWMTIRTDPAMRSLFIKYSARMNANKAIVRIAKHLLLRLRAVWLSREPYQSGMVSPLNESSIAA